MRNMVLLLIQLGITEKRSVRVFMPPGGYKPVKSIHTERKQVWSTKYPGRKEPEPYNV